MKSMSFESFNEQYLANSSGRFPSNSKPTDPSSSFVRNGNGASKLNNYNTQTNESNSFQFPRQITNFSINMVDEDEIPEEKMHSPRTPYGSVPDPSSMRTSTDPQNTQKPSHHYYHQQQSQQFTYQQVAQHQKQYLYPARGHSSRVSGGAHMSYPHQNAQPMQRNISASSSFDSCTSSVASEHVLYHTPTLSATSSMNRSGFYSNITSPETTPVTSPCTTPKSYVIQVNGQQTAIQIEQEEEKQKHQQLPPLTPMTPSSNVDQEEEEDDDESKANFGDETRTKKLETIHATLTALTKTKKNGHCFERYKKGAASYSGYNSGANTNGTATPNSVATLSRSSSCNSIGGGSECSSNWHPDGTLVDEDDEYVSGTTTPVLSSDYLLEPVITLSTPKLQTGQEFSEDEMETPVPTSNEVFDESVSPFDFEQTKLVHQQSGVSVLAEIVEDEVDADGEDEEEEEEIINITPKTKQQVHCEIEEKLDEYNLALEGIKRPGMTRENSATSIQSAFDMIDDDESDDEEDEVEPEPVQYDMINEEIYRKGTAIQSSRVLFLDVDGVLLTTKEQQEIKHGEIKFNNDVTSLLIKLYNETDCDIIISSTWQFHKDTHLQYLIRYLVACGWDRSKIHTLMELLPSSTAHDDDVEYDRKWYESSPYCRCRARGIQKIVELYGYKIDRWCCLDDLPLASQKYVCVPKEGDLDNMVSQISDAYFKVFSWRTNQKNELMPGIQKCVKYALTQLNSCLFSSQSYRFGYEYNETMIYYQADAIAKCINLTYEVKDNQTYLLILQNMMGVMKQYIGSNLTHQGDPYITPFLVKTDQQIGITPTNIENVITLLTYPDTKQPQQQQLQLQLNDIDSNIISTV